MENSDKSSIMLNLNFRKMHGAGNDFVILDFRAPKDTEEVTLSEDQIRHICNRNTGVGCDQLVTLHAPDNGGDIAARFFNSDGSESGACGNATRCIGHIVMSEQASEACAIETGGGLLHASMAGDHLVQVDMGAPKNIKDLDLPHAGLSNPVYVDMGNPHCVFFVDDVEEIDVAGIGAYVEHHKMFPNRTNVEFVQMINRNEIRLRTWERGSGETLACGTAACATIVAAAQRGLTERTAAIHANGGDLQMEWRESDDHILMTGPVAYVFSGNVQ